MSETTGILSVLRHEPIRPPRPSFLREQVFAGRWRDLMLSRRGAIHQVLRDYLAPIGQREASVAASVITWLGTNMGQALLEDAERRQTTDRPSGWSPSYACSDAYLSAWCAENRRKHGINNGVRTLEAILSVDISRGICAATAADYEVAENVFFWLGQPDGQRFLSLGQTEASALARIESYSSFCRTGNQAIAIAQSMRGSLRTWAETGKVAKAAVAAVEAAYPETGPRESSAVAGATGCEAN